MDEFLIFIFSLGYCRDAVILILVNNWLIKRSYWSIKNDIKAFL